MESVVRVGEPWFTDVERGLVVDAMEHDEIGHFGPRVREFEESFSDFCGAAWGVTTSSGTTALHLALAAVGVGPGDEVVVPATTMIATVNAVTYTGASPVLVDSDPSTWTLDPALLRVAITPRTRAIIPVHLYGHPCDMDGIMGPAEEQGITVLEDAAQAHGAEYRGVRAGHLGHVAAFSFYLNKIITTGEGGMVVTDDKELAERARRLRNQAFDPDRRFLHRELGFNYRMTNLQAAVGVGQLRRIDDILRRKRDLAACYRRLLETVPGLMLRPQAPWATPVCWMFAVLVEDEFGMTRDELMTALAARGVESRAFFVPLHHQPLYRAQFAGRSYPVAERLGERGLYLPSGTGLTNADLEFVADVVRTVQAGGR